MEKEYMNREELLEHMKQKVGEAIDMWTIMLDSIKTGGYGFSYFGKYEWFEYDEIASEIEDYILPRLKYLANEWISIITLLTLEFEKEFDVVGYACWIDGPDGNVIDAITIMTADWEHVIRSSNYEDGAAIDVYGSSVSCYINGDPLTAVRKVIHICKVDEASYANEDKCEED